ncbi:MBL fold metallo-hydrolase [Candidimonas nitroreducens]|nr:MBL fold metallo-hydrolase [Candidimonas nitroreducens]
MLPSLTRECLEENRHWLQPHSLGPNDIFSLTYQSYIVRTPHHTILVDSCLGNDKPRLEPEWNMKTDDNFVRGLAAVDVTLEDIDYVMCTHLHVDHAGWNTRLVDGRWVPTFPNARYIFGRRELESAKTRYAKGGYPSYANGVLPILEAGRADIVEDDYQIGDYVRLLPTPGHTDGHVAFCFGKSVDAAVMTGDLLHVPLQIRYPELSFSRDKDSVQSALTRRSFLEHFCDTPTLCCTAHLPSPSVGRIKRWGDGYRLLPVGCA